MNTLLENAKEIIDFYTRRQLTEQQIAGIYGYSVQVVTDLLLSMEVELHGENWKYVEPLIKTEIWDHEQEIERLYEEERMSSPKLAKIYQCSEGTITNILKARGVKLRRRRRDEVWKHAKEIVKLYTRKRLTTHQIAKIYVCSARLICDILREAGVELRDPTLRTPVWADGEEMKVLYDQGMSTVEIGKEFDCSSNTVSTILKSRGVRMRDRHAKHKAWGHAEEIARLNTQEDMSLEELATQFECSPPVIRKILKSQGVEIDSERRHTAWKYAKEITRLNTQERMTVEKLAHTYKCNGKLIRNILKSQGVDLSTRRNHKAWEHAEEIARLKAEEGMSTRELQIRFECSRSVICDIFKEYGVVLQRYKRKNRF